MTMPTEIPGLVTEAVAEVWPGATAGAIAGAVDAGNAAGSKSGWIYGSIVAKIREYLELAREATQGQAVASSDPLVDGILWIDPVTNDLNIRIGGTIFTVQLI